MFWYIGINSFNFSVAKTPFSVIIPVIKLAGVTSNDGFQQLIPETRGKQIMGMIGGEMTEVFAQHYRMI